MGVIAVAQSTIYDINDITVSAVAPSYPMEDALWLDVSVSPSQLRRWTGTTWEAVDDQADLISAIEDVQNQVNGLSVGGENLLNNTGDDPITITESTTLAVLDLQTYKNAWDGWMTFRAKLSPVSGTWKLRIKFTATSAAQAVLGQLILGSGVSDVTTDEVVTVDSETCTTEQWLTITTQVQSTNFIIEPQIILVSGSGETAYSYPKFELGNLPTQWQPSNEDVSIAMQTVRSDCNAYVDQIANDIESHINLMVTKVEYNERDQEIRSSISALSLNNENIQADVARHDALLGDIGTHIVIDPQNGMILRQDQNANYEAVLASDTLSFRQTGSSGAVMASFGVSGGYVDRLRSNKTLSVGSERLGWYDMTQLSGGGVADKWRNGTDDVQVCVIKEQPVNYYGTSPASFTVVAEDATGYQWEYREKPEDDAWGNAPNSSTSNTYTVALSTAIQYEYRCKVLNSRSITYSRTVRAFDTSGPVILCDIPEEVQPSSTIQVFAAGQPTYQWQTKTGSGSWQNAGTGSSITASQSADYYRCILTANGHSAYTRVCKVDSAS